MYKNIVYLILPLMLVLGCSQRGAINFNNDIIEEERGLLPTIQEAEKNIERVISSQQFDSLVFFAGKMESEIGAVITKIESLKVPGAKGADNFRKGALDYFGFMKSVYTSYKKLGAAETDEEREEEYGRFEKLLKRRDEVVTDFQQQQKEFAKANNFQVK